MSHHIERVVPKEMNQNNGMLIEHRARYKFASNYVGGRVLDLACGVGYGTEIMLAMGKGIKKIVGIDKDEETIEYARENYDCRWTEFGVGKGTDFNLVKEWGEFDSIVSLETVEHIKNDYKFIRNLDNLLKKGGKAVISTPFGSGREAECSNPYHYRQYTREEFEKLLSEAFSRIEIFCQRGDKIEKPKSEEKYYLMVAVCS